MSNVLSSPANGIDFSKPHQVTITIPRCRHRQDCSPTMHFPFSITVLLALAAIGTTGPIGKRVHGQCSAADPRICIVGGKHHLCSNVSLRFYICS